MALKKSRFTQIFLLLILTYIYGGRYAVFPGFEGVYTVLNVYRILYNFINIM